MFLVEGPCMKILLTKYKEPGTQVGKLFTENLGKLFLLAAI